ncbi:hypothetical protein U0070_016110 [Myodes glareolus]|uniref:Glutamate-rich protein 5 n=2 Tax=Myodes glareolus TaxID=447135 RepID=A0AAW0IDS9_MYOGA
MPCTPGREAAFYGSAQRPGQVLLERPKASVVPTANGVKACHQPSPANDEASGKDAAANGVKACHQPSPANDEAPGKDAADPSGPTKKIEPLVQGEESDLPQPGGNDDTLGAEEMKKDVEARTEAQSLKGNAETEPLGTEAGSQPLNTPGERDSPGAVEDTEIPQAAGVTKLLETAENALPLETAKELPPEEAMGKDAQPETVEAIPKENSSPERSEGYQFVEKAEQKELQETSKDNQETSKDKQFQVLEAIPKENNSPEVAEGGQSAESSEEQQPQEAGRKDEQPQLLERILKENETPQVPGGSQLVQTPVMNESLCETPDGTRNTQGSQSEASIGSREKLAGAAETAANGDTAREIHTNKEEQHIEGETGEKMEAEMKHEKGSEEAEVKEQETGEAADLEPAGDSDGRATVHSLL